MKIKYETTETSEEYSLRDIVYERQKEITLKYKGKVVGNHRIDFIIEDKVIVELKAVEAINKIFESQLLTYLRAANKRIVLLINFNVDLLKKSIKRIII